MSKDNLGFGEIVLDGYTHKLKPLTLNELPLFLKVAKCFSHLKEGSSVEETFSRLDEDGILALKQIVKVTLERSLPTVPEDKRDELGMQYFMVILPKVLEISMPQTHENVKKSALK